MTECILYWNIIMAVGGTSPINNFIWYPTRALFFPPGGIYHSGGVLPSWWRLHCCCNKVIESICEANKCFVEILTPCHLMPWWLQLSHLLFVLVPGSVSCWLAAGLWCSQGLVVVWELQLERRGRPERVSVSWEHRGQAITSLCWDSSTLRVFVGDSGGKVSFLRAGSSKLGKVFVLLDIVSFLHNTLTVHKFMWELSKSPLSLETFCFLYFLNIYIF